MKKINYILNIESAHIDIVKGKGRRPVAKEDATKIGFNAVCYGLDIYRKVNPSIKDKVIAVRIKTIDKKYAYLIRLEEGEYMMLDHQAFLNREVSTRYETYVIEDNEEFSINGNICEITPRKCIAYALYALQGKDPQPSSVALDIAYTSLLAVHQNMPKRSMLPLYNYNAMVGITYLDIVAHRIEDIYDVRTANANNINALYI